MTNQDSAKPACCPSNRQPTVQNTAKVIFSLGNDAIGRYLKLPAPETQCSQLLGAVWGSLTTTFHLYYGRNPQLGSSQIIGTNGVPYPDRVISCLRIGHFYEPRLVSSLLAAPGSTAILEDSTGTAVHGYRLRKRRVGSISDELDEATQVVMESFCALIAKTIDNIFDACSALGYSNLTRDHLRVVDDWDSAGLFLYEGDEIHTVRTIFDWETLVSNLSVGLVLIRWVLALVSLHSGAYRGRSLWFSGGIGTNATMKRQVVQ
ncbi:hypothetical protein V7S43_013416 [Phytophthora oleae]|uniref:Uncharacterized protein n=1 Tax=Phytophthora oleae TaxID=2107226 RepID=A0ABD3F6R1_9STRA